MSVCFVKKKKEKLVSRAKDDFFTMKNKSESDSDKSESDSDNSTRGGNWESVETEKNRNKILQSWFLFFEFSVFEV